MVNFLAERGLDMSLITFYGFKKDDRQFLTRQVEVQAPEKPSGSTYSYSKSENLKALTSLAEKMGVRGLFDKMKSFFSNEFPQAYSYPGKTGYGYSLTERTDKGTLSNRVYISIYIWENKHEPVELVFWNRAVTAAKEAFEEFLSQRRERFRNEHDSQRTWVKSVEDWENLAIALKPLLPEIISSWQAKMQTSIEEGPVEE